MIHTIICIMILWVKRFALIVGLAIVVVACEESGEIGLDLDPKRGGFSAKYYEIPLRTSVLQMDSIFTKGHPRVLVSHFSDPDFGDLDATGYARLFLGLSKFEPDSLSVYDSLIFNFNLTYQYGPRDLMLQQIYVHELEDTINNDLKFSWDSTAYMQDPLGQNVFNLAGLDTVWIDTVLSIRLADTLGLRLFQGAKDDPDIFADHNKFQRFFNGIAMVPSVANSKALGINLLSGDSKITLHYHLPLDTVGKSYSFNFYSTDGYNRFTAFYHSIKTNRSGTALEGLIDTNVEYDPGNGNNYTQSGSGIVTRLSLIPLYQFLDTISEIVVNRAELVFQTEPYEEYLSPPGPMQLYVIDKDNQYVFVNGRPKKLLDEESQGNELYLKFTQDELTGIRTYSGVISVFTQGLISDKSVDSLLVVRPYNTGSTVNRFVGDNTTVVIKLYYSELD